MNKKGILLAVVSALIYGYTPVLCAKSYALGNNPITLTFFRSFMILPILAFLMIKNKIGFKLEKDEAFKIVLIGLFGSVITTLFLYSSYQYIAIGSATTLHFLYPLFVTLICHFIYRDKFSKKQMFSLLLSLFGIMLFIDFKDVTKINGIFLALFSGITFSIYLVGIEKANLTKMNSYKLSFYLALTVCIFLLFYGTYTNSLKFIQPIQSYGYMFLISFLAQFIAVIFLKNAIGLIGSSMASLFSMAEPVSSIFFGYLFLNEQVFYTQIMGCILISLAVVLLLTRDLVNNT